MKLYSPLRYPGGKNKLSKFIALICKENLIDGHYVEPYAGGASVALFLLIEGYVKRVTINDYDRSIYAFWYSILNHTEKICSLIEGIEVNIDNWHKLRLIQNNKNNAEILDLGFSTFFLNRTNISGIISAGPIGGYSQTGAYKIDCRFNKQDLISRIKKIAQFKDKIQIKNLDAIELVNDIESLEGNLQTIYYFDPPYYVKGKSLYINYYVHKNHEEVGKVINNIRNSRWIISYDNVPEIKYIYKDYRMIEYSFVHTAYRSREGKEVLFFSNNLKVPYIENPVKVLVNK
jgi:DNA adenine methylase